MGQYQEDPSHLVRPRKRGWLACLSMCQEETLAPTVFCHWQRSGAFGPGVWGSVQFSSGGMLELPRDPLAALGRSYLDLCFQVCRTGGVGRGSGSWWHPGTLQLRHYDATLTTNFF